MGGGSGGLRKDSKTMVLNIIGDACGLENRRKGSRFQGWVETQNKRFL